MKIKSLYLFALLALPGCMLFRACGGNPSINRAVSPHELIGEWYLDNSAIETARSMMVNMPEYVIDDISKSNRIILYKDGTCDISLIDLAFYKTAQYFEKLGEWNLTNIPYNDSSSRANNTVTLPWNSGSHQHGIRMQILEEEGNLVLYHYLFLDEDIGVKVKYRRSHSN